MHTVSSRLRIEESSSCAQSDRGRRRTYSRQLEGEAEKTSVDFMLNLLCFDYVKSLPPVRNYGGARLCLTESSDHSPYVTSSRRMSWRLISRTHNPVNSVSSIPLAERRTRSIASIAQYSEMSFCKLDSTGSLLKDQVQTRDQRVRIPYVEHLTQRRSFSGFDLSARHDDSPAIGPIIAQVQRNSPYTLWCGIPCKDCGYQRYFKR
jgi:hypothetical protein